jgi:hypothetical protein
MKGLSSVGILGLGALAALQLGLLLRGSVPEPVVSVGTKLPALVSVDPTVPDVNWGESDHTVLLVFHSECRFCDDVADDWRDWLLVDRKARTILVSRDSPGAAAAYASKHGWPPGVFTVAPNGARDLQAQLTRRTPWIYVVDGEGRLIHEGHGAQLALLTQTLDPIEER